MRKDSLKEKLRNYIRGYSAPIPHWQLMNCVKSWGYRESNAERRLREMVEIDKVYEHNCIKFYKWRGGESTHRPTESTQNITPVAKAFLNLYGIDGKVLSEKQPIKQLKFF